MTAVYSAHMASEAPEPEPIFIYGMRPRTGTHFLANLLCQHPDCVTSAIAEDSLLIYAHLLSKYVTRTNGQWTAVAGKNHEAYEDLLHECIGSGLTAFLRQVRRTSDEERKKKFGGVVTDGLRAKHLVTRTPVADNLELFFRFFPRARMLILVRDGRAVVESATRSFGGDAERQIRAWAQAAKRILEFSGKHCRDGKPQYMLVRFEDLYIRTEDEMRRILLFLGLNIESYDFPRALNLPVVGSSTFKRPPGKVQWTPVMKTADFDPLARANSWTRSQHERFNWIAGDQLEKLGYERKTFFGQNLIWRIRNQVKDLSRSMKSLVKAGNK